MRLSERVERAILGGDPTTRVGRARLKAAIQARRVLVRLGDPTVRYRIGSVELELPLSHELPFYRHDHPSYDRQLGAIAAALGGPVVDVGANVGDTAAAIREESGVPILCVEGDPTFFDLLERNAAKIGGARARAGVRRGRRTSAGSRGERDCTRRRGRQTRFERSPSSGFRAASGVRAPGADQARHGWDGRPHPAREPVAASDSGRVLFFEYDPHVGAEPHVFERLREVGYATADWYENTGEHVATVELPDHLHDRYVGHGSARYADVCVRPR